MAAWAVQSARQRYVCGDIEVDQFEAEIEAALRADPEALDRKPAPLDVANAVLKDAYAVTGSTEVTAGPRRIRGYKPLLRTESSAEVSSVQGAPSHIRAAIALDLERRFAARQRLADARQMEG